MPAQPAPVVGLERVGGEEAAAGRVVDPGAEPFQPGDGELAGGADPERADAAEEVRAALFVPGSTGRSSGGAVGAPAGGGPLGVDAGDRSGGEDGVSPTRTGAPAYAAVSQKISVPSTAASSPSASTRTRVRGPGHRCGG